MSKFVAAFDKRTGKPRRVPENWLAHPVFGKHLSLTEPGADEAPETPTDDQTPASGDQEEEK